MNKLNAHGIVVTLMASAVLSTACSGGGALPPLPPDDTGDPVATGAGALSDIKASHETKRLVGVTKWQISRDAAKWTVTALDDHDGLVATLTLYPETSEPASRYRIFSHSDSGTEEFTLSIDGQIDGDDSTRGARLAALLYVDAQAAIRVSRESATEKSVGTVNTQASNLWYIAYQQYFEVGGGLFGARMNFPFGGRCRNGYTRTSYASAVTNGSLNCFVNGWSTADPYDCTVSVHIGAGAFNGGECHVVIYQNHPTPR